MKADLGTHSTRSLAKGKRPVHSVELDKPSLIASDGLPVRCQNPVFGKSVQPKSKHATRKVLLRAKVQGGNLDHR